MSPYFQISVWLAICAAAVTAIGLVLYFRANSKHKDAGLITTALAFTALLVFIACASMAKFAENLSGLGPVEPNAAYGGKDFLADASYWPTSESGVPITVALKMAGENYTTLAADMCRMEERGSSVSDCRLYMQKDDEALLGYLALVETDEGIHLVTDILPREGNECQLRGSFYQNHDSASLEMTQFTGQIDQVDSAWTIQKRGNNIRMTNHENEFCEGRPSKIDVVFEEIAAITAVAEPA